jgi:hypothetical protein
MSVGSLKARPVKVTSAGKGLRIVAVGGRNPPGTAMLG